MPVTICFVCAYNLARNRIQRSDERPSYSDCDRCQKPTCRGHGKRVAAERFLCILCIENERP